MTREEAIEVIKQDIPCEQDADLIEAFDMAIQALSQEPCDDVVSRQAVIYYIKGHIHEIITESGTDKNAHTNSILKALINGVETMPTVNPQPCDDAISREAAINIASLHCLTIDETVKALEQLPSVTRQTGEWIVEEEVEDGNRQCRCSVCGHGDIQAYEVEVPYCWFCGSKMLGYAEAE